MVPKPNLGGDSIFHPLPQSTPKGLGVLPCAHTKEWLLLVKKKTLSNNQMVISKE